MFRPVRRSVTAVLAVLAVLAFAMLPAEHVHVAPTDDGHHSDLVHRHFEPHHRPAAQATVDHADDERDVQWLAASFTSPKTFRHVGPDAHLVTLVLPAPQPPPPLDGTVLILFVSVHDPPWAAPSGLRAPPAASPLT